MPAPSLPNLLSVKSLCDSFFSHFKNKISLVRSAFPDHTLNPVQVDSPQVNPVQVDSPQVNPVQVDSPQVNSLLASLTPAAVDEVGKIITFSPNTSCVLDPLPTTLLKACFVTLLYPITNMVNASLCSGLFSSASQPIS